jgi:hypothetical protein
MWQTDSTGAKNTQADLPENPEEMYVRPCLVSKEGQAFEAQDSQESAADSAAFPK